MATRNPSRASALVFPADAQPPTYLSTLVGRDRELEDLAELLRAARLVSLVGAGGTGKTRLAAALATALRARFRDAVAWIDLAPLADPALVAQHTATTLGLREHAGAAPEGSVAERIGRSAALLVLDNCEHLLDACAVLVDGLLRRCPELRVVTTSRQAFGMTGEKVWLVPPLSVPASDEDPSGASGAVQLFVQRARDAVPDFALTPANARAVAHVCRRLDGLPLAIELAAARVRLLPPEQLAGRLDSMLGLLASGSRVTLPRHRTLRALIDWSYDLLSPGERRLLARLAVFAGGFTLDAAEDVAGDEALPPDQVLDHLAGLVDKSLVAAGEWRGEARFTLLDTVRQYARERLREAGEDETMRHRHAEHFSAFVEAAEPHVLGGTRATPWMARLEQEQGNLRAAMDWCEERGERAALELRFGTALHWFHFARGQFEEPRHRLQRALSRSGDDLPPRLRGRALATLGYLAFWTGDHGAAAAPLTEGVALLRTAHSPPDLAFALTGLATLTGLAGDAPAAHPLFDQAEAALGDPDGFAPGDFPPALLYAFACYWRGAVALAAGDLALARASYEKAIHVARGFGNHASIAHPLAALARVLALQGDAEGAEECLCESIPLHNASDDRWGLLQAVEVGALLAVLGERPEQGARLIGVADRIRAQIAAALAPHEQQERERLLAAIHARLAPQAFARAHGQGWALPPDRILAEVVGAPVPRAAAPRQAQAHAPAPARVPAPAPVAGPADLRVRALGALQLFRGEEPLEGEAFGSSKPRELLLLLLCHPDGVTREQVGVAFWPESSAAQVKNSFHVTLHRLRRALDRPDWVEAAGERYRLRPDLRVDFDAARFEEEVRAALEAPDAAERRLVGALALYRGEFLEGEVAGDWHLEPRERLRRLHVRALLALGTRRMEGERFAEAVDPLRQLLARERLHEDACRRLMTCLERTGERVQALRLYETHAALLREELGTEPEPATRALFEQIRQAVPA